tara:strand:+ start:782 stop:1324 length:543 start_codon:yes stop_codon:yes gene_type:complete
MGLFGKKKKEEEIPTLPELPAPEDFSLPKLPQSPLELENKEFSQLPQLPNLKKTEPDLSPKVIKQEISNPQDMQKSNFSSEQPIIQKTQPLPTQHMPIQTKTKPRSKEIDPIYIRLDKFESSIQAFEEIKTKIEQIESLLVKTREIKQKEEQELLEWERELQLIKSRIDSVDKSVFDKLD